MTTKQRQTIEAFAKYFPELEKHQWVNSRKSVHVKARSWMLIILSAATNCNSDEAIAAVEEWAGKKIMLHHRGKMHHHLSKELKQVPKDGYLKELMQMVIAEVNADEIFKNSTE